MLAAMHKCFSQINLKLLKLVHFKATVASHWTYSTNVFNFFIDSSRQKNENLVKEISINFCFLWTIHTLFTSGESTSIRMVMEKKSWIIGYSERIKCEKLFDNKTKRFNWTLCNNWVSYKTVYYTDNGCYALSKSPVSCVPRWKAKSCLYKDTAISN